MCTCLECKKEIRCCNTFCSVECDSKWHAKIKNVSSRK